MMINGQGIRQAGRQKVEQVINDIRKAELKGLSQ